MLWARARDAAEGQPLEPWSPPENLGPIPKELLSRARHIQQSQRITIGHLRAAKTDIAGRLKAVRKVPKHFRDDTPTYLDLVG